MLDATPPITPNQGIEIVNAPDPSVQLGQADRTFVWLWYKFLNDVGDFMAAVRNFPRRVAQADLAAMGAKLGSKKAGVQVWVAEFNHMLRWSGATWDFAPGDSGSGYTVTFLSAPTAAGWALCDASTVSYLKADGTVGTQLLPATPGDYFRR